MTPKIPEKRNEFIEKYHHDAWLFLYRLNKNHPDVQAYKKYFAMDIYARDHSKAIYCLYPLFSSTIATIGSSCVYLVAHAMNLNSALPVSDIGIPTIAVASIGVGVVWAFAENIYKNKIVRKKKLPTSAKKVTALYYDTVMEEALNNEFNRI